MSEGRFAQARLEELEGEARALAGKIVKVSSIVAAAGLTAVAGTYITLAMLIAMPEAPIPAGGKRRSGRASPD